jgi:hypothetical protein
VILRRQKVVFLGYSSTLDFSGIHCSRLIRLLSL